MSDQTNQWRCRGCNRLLAVGVGGHFVIKYKQAEYEVTGIVSARCSRCHVVNKAQAHNGTTNVILPPDDKSGSLWTTPAQQVPIHVEADITVSAEDLQKVKDNSRWPR